MQDLSFWLWRWIHVVAGIAWIGHLWFFNFVNANLQKELTPDTKKLVNPGLMLRALFFFRWGVLFSNGMASLNDPANAGALWILVGMLFGTVMWFNVWFIIWPAQKKIIGAMQGGPAADPALAPRATLASKINTYLSLPLLIGMISAHTYAAFGQAGFGGVVAGILLGLGAVWLAYKYSPAISTKLIQG